MERQIGRESPHKSRMICSPHGGFFSMKLFPRISILVCLACFMEAEDHQFPDLNGMPESPESHLQEILRILAKVTGEMLQEPEKTIERKEDTGLMLKLVLKDIRKHCELHFMISPDAEAASLNALNRILWQLEEGKDGRGEIMCAKDVNSEEMAKSVNERKVQENISRNGVIQSLSNSDVVVVYTNATIEKDVEGLLLSMLSGMDTPEFEPNPQKPYVHVLHGMDTPVLEPNSQKPYVHVLHENTEQSTTTPNEPNQKWDAQNRLLKEKGTNDGKQRKETYTLKQLLVLGFAIIFLVFSVVLVAALPTTWIIMDDRQKFTMKNMFERSVLQDDCEASGPSQRMKLLQYTEQNISYKPLAGGYQSILTEQKRTAIDGYHKKIKKNHRVTFMKCPQRKKHKRTKHHGINEHPLTEGWKGRSILLGDLPIAPPLPEGLFWNYSQGGEQSLPKYNFSPGSDNSGLMASQRDIMKEYTEQLGSLYPSRYTSQRSTQGVSAETSSPILIHINPHHGQLPSSQAFNGDNIANSSIGLTADQTDGYTPRSLSSPHWHSDRDANLVPTSPAHTIYPVTDDSRPAAARSLIQSPTIQGGSNEQDVYNYSSRSGSNFAGNMSGMFRSPFRAQPSRIDGKVTQIPEHFTQSLPLHAADNTQDTWPHNLRDWQNPQKITTTQTFHLCDKRSPSFKRTVLMKHIADRPEREGESSFINQQKSRPHSPGSRLKESAQNPNSYKESFKQDCFKRVTKGLIIQPSSSRVPSKVKCTSRHTLRSPDTSMNDDRGAQLYSNVHSLNQNFKRQDNTLSGQNDTRQPKPTEIPITRIVHIPHKRSHSYSDSPSVNQGADRQSRARSRSISPQKLLYSLGARSNTNFIYPYGYDEASPYNTNLSYGYVADNTRHPSKSSAQPLRTDVSNVQSIANSSFKDKQNVEGAFNSFTRSVYYDAEEMRQDRLEFASFLPPPAYIDGHIQKSSTPLRQSLQSNDSVRRKLEFSSYSPLPHMEANIKSRSPNHSLSTGINNASIKSLSTSNVIRERTSHSLGQQLSPHANAEVKVPFYATQSSSPGFHKNTQNTSNSNTESGFPTVDDNAQCLHSRSNESLTTDVEDNELYIPYVPFLSLSTNFEDNECEFDHTNDNIQHPFNSSIQPCTSNIDNTQHAEPSTSSHFNGDVWNATMYSSDHVEPDKQTASNSSSNLLLNDVDELQSVFSNNTLFSPDGREPVIDNSLLQSESTHDEHLLNNSNLSTQSLPLDGDDEAQNASYHSIQSYIAADEQSRSGQFNNSSSSQVDRNKQSASNKGLHLLDSNGTDDQDSQSDFPSYPLFPFMDNSMQTIFRPPITSPSCWVNNVASTASGSRVPCTNAEDSVQGVSDAFSQLRSTDVGESKQMTSQTLKSSISSLHSHSPSIPEKKKSNSSIHSQSSQVKDNTLDEFKSSDESLKTYTDEISTPKTPTPFDPVLDKAHSTRSSPRLPLVPTDDNGKGIPTSPSHSQSTHVRNSPFTQDYTDDKHVRDLSSPTSQTTQNSNTKGISHPSNEVFPDNHGNRRCIVHEVRSGGSPNSHCDCSASCSTHSQLGSFKKSESSSLESLIYLNNGQEIFSDMPIESKYTNRINHKHDSSSSSSSSSSSQSSTSSDHHSTPDMSKTSVHSLRTNPNRASGSNSSIPSLTSLFQNNLQYFSYSYNKIFGGNVDDNIHDEAASSCQFIQENSEQVAQPATKSQLDLVHATDNDNRQDLLYKSRPNLTPTAYASSRTGLSSSPPHSIRSNTEKSEKVGSGSSVILNRVSNNYNERLGSSTVPSLSETEDVKEVLSDSSNRSHFAPFVADHEQTSTSSNFVSKNVQGVFHSRNTINDQQVFRTHNQLPQVINMMVLDIELLPPKANDDQIPFCYSSQSSSSHGNTCAQDDSYYPPSFLYGDDNSQSLFPPPQILYNHIENTKGERSSSRSRTSPVSNKLLNASYSPIHFNSACSNFQGDHDTQIQSILGSNESHSGFKSPKISSQGSNNLQGGSESSIQGESNFTDNNLQNASETSTQSWSNLVSNNQPDDSALSASSYSTPVSHRPQDVSLSYTKPVHQFDSNKSQTPCSSIHSDNRSENICAFRPSQYSQSPHAFYQVKPSRISAQSLISLVSDHALAESQDFDKSSNYIEDQQDASSLSTHRARNVPGSSMSNHIDNSKQSPPQVSHLDKGVQYSYTQPKRTHSHNRQDKYKSYQPQSNYAAKMMPQTARSAKPSSRCKYSADVASDFLSSAPSSSVFPSSTSPDDSSGTWSFSNHSVSYDNQSMATSSMIRTLSPRSDDAASDISGFSLSTLYDDYDDDDNFLAPS